MRDALNLGMKIVRGISFLNCMHKNCKKQKKTQMFERLLIAKEQLNQMHPRMYTHSKSMNSALYSYCADRGVLISKV